MKKEWQTPVLEVLNINMTMAGPGNRYKDAAFDDCDDRGNVKPS
ncbi:paeninodin family lasso peptide [Bacillus sp. E(2018)]|nr:paeninodin family lasso peptide [Bacillus sp. E(2018)]